MNIGIAHLRLELLEKPDKSEIGGMFTVESIWIASDCLFDPDESVATAPTFLFSTITSCYLKQNEEETHMLRASIANITCRPQIGDLGTIRQFIRELKQAIPVDEGAEIVKDRPQLSLVFEGHIDDVSGEIYDQNKQIFARILFKGLSCRVDNGPDGSIDISATVKVFQVQDTRPKTPFPLVATLWNEHAVAASPQLRFQAKQGRHVGGISVFNHIEININPSVVNYDATFFRFFIDFVLNTNLQAPPFEQIRCVLPPPEVSFPPIEILASLLPSMKDEMREMLAHRSVESVIIVDRAEANFLLRYFKITSTKLKISYYNPENTIIQQVSEFNGLLHDVILQDFTATMKTLIDALFDQISSDIIPQFIKHCLGIGKIPGAKETDLQMWLSNDHEKAIERKKQLLFGKQPKKGK
jgi:hypothetical protein